MIVWTPSAYQVLGAGLGLLLAWGGDASGVTVPTDVSYLVLRDAVVTNVVLLSAAVTEVRLRDI